MRVLGWLLLGRTDGLRARARRRLRQLIHPGGRHAGVGGMDAGPGAPRPAGASHESGGLPVPDGFVAVVRRDELTEGTLREVFVQGRSVAVALVGGQVYAMDGTCPHAGGPLAEGRLEGTTLSCPMHGWSFDVVTGDCHVNPEDRIRILGVQVVDDVVCVEV